MSGHVILSHGFESGPAATKVSALAEVAEALGWRVTRPEFRDLDALGEIACVDARIARLTTYVTAGESLVLGGSSMGAFASGLASLDVPVVGLFLLALPTLIPGYARSLDQAAVPTAIVHGWSDEVCPAGAVVDYAHARHADLYMVNADHRLGDHVEFCARQFHDFLQSLAR